MNPAQGAESLELGDLVQLTASSVTAVAEASGHAEKL